MSAVPQSRLFGGPYTVKVIGLFSWQGLQDCPATFLSSSCSPENSGDENLAFVKNHSALKMWLHPQHTLNPLGFFLYGHDGDTVLGAAEGITLKLACLTGPRKLKLWHVPCEATPAGPRLKGPLLIKLHGPKRPITESSQEITPAAHIAHGESTA